MLENYEPASVRIAKFWADNPNGRIITHMLEYDGQRVVFRAEAYTDRDDTRPVSTGWAEEILGSTNVNKTSFVENCETSSIARCLANYIYAASDPEKRPSQEEMGKVKRLSSYSEGGVAGPARTGKKTITNKRAGTCQTCFQLVAAGEGIATIEDGGTWRTFHNPGTCSLPQEEAF